MLPIGGSGFRVDRKSLHQPSRATFPAMEFGRVPDPGVIDFAMPPDEPRNLSLLGDGRRPTGQPPEFRVGTPRWADPGYVGTLYPEGTRQADYLLRYAEQFATIELNTTYYGVQPGSIARWASQVPDDFRFCAKYPKAITHDGWLRDVDAESDAFAAALEGFGAKRGPAWLLLPAGFGPEHLPQLSAWLRRHGARAAPLAIELRHPVWFENRSAGDAVFGILEEHGVTAVITDVAGRRDVLHQRLTTDTVFVRFVGNRQHRSDFTRMEAWIDRLADWATQGAAQIYVFCHQPEEHLNIAIAERLVAAVADAPDRFNGARLRGPQPPARQGSLFGD